MVSESGQIFKQKETSTDIVEYFTRTGLNGCRWRYDSAGSQLLVEEFTSSATPVSSDFGSNRTDKLVLQSTLLESIGSLVEVNKVVISIYFPQDESAFDSLTLPRFELYLSENQGETRTLISNFELNYNQRVYVSTNLGTYNSVIFYFETNVDVIMTSAIAYYDVVGVY